MSKSYFRFTNNQTRPRDGWHWYHPELPDMTPLTTMAFKTLKKAIKEFYLANDYPITQFWDKEVDDAICSQMDDPSKNCELVHPASGPVMQDKITITMVRNFLLTITAWIKGGAKLVDQKEADRRAAICQTCPYKTAIIGCKSCAGLSTTIIKAIGNKQTRIDLAQNACGICGCSLAASLWLPQDIKAKYLSQDQRDSLPSHCWMRPEELRSSSV